MAELPAALDNYCCGACRFQDERTRMSVIEYCKKYNEHVPQCYLDDLEGE